MSRVVIIGGGLSGLAAAHLLQHRHTELKSGLQLTVLEARPSAGGLLKSTLMQEFLLEETPTLFLPPAALLLSILQRLRLEEQRISVPLAAHTPYLLHKGKLLAVPRTVPDFLRSPLVSSRSRLRLLAEPVIPARRDPSDESLDAFLTRRLGDEMGTLAAALLANIGCFGDPKTLSASALAPALVKLEKEAGSLLQGVLKQRHKSEAPTPGRVHPGLMSLRDGMGALAQGLASELGPALRTSSRVASVRLPQNHQTEYQVVLASGEVLGADAVIITTTAASAAPLLEAQDAQLARTLSEFSQASLALVHLGFPRARIKHPLDGFGFLIPPEEHLHLLAVSFDSTVFPGRAPDGHVLIRTMLGGATDPQLLQRSDAELTALVLKELSPLLGIQAAPTLQHVTRLPNVIPQYSLGHTARVTALTQRLVVHPGLYLTGGSYRGLGMNESLKDVQATCNSVLEALRAQEAR